MHFKLFESAALLPSSSLSSLKKFCTRHKVPFEALKPRPLVHACLNLVCLLYRKCVTHIYIPIVTFGIYKAIKKCSIIQSSLRIERVHLCIPSILTHNCVISIVGCDLKTSPPKNRPIPRVVELLIRRLQSNIKLGRS